MPDTAPLPSRPAPAGPDEGWSAPSTAFAVAAAIAPTAAALQSKAMAPVVLIALACGVLQHRRRRGGWPWPQGLVARLGLALGAWAAVSALWAPDAWRAVTGGLTIGGIAVLAAAGARVAREDGEPARRRLAWCLGAGLAIGLAVALADTATGHMVRAGVRGLAEASVKLTAGLKPAATIMGLLLPLIAALPLPRGWRMPLILAGLVGILVLPGDTAKIAALAGAAALAVAARFGRRVPAALGLLGAAMLLLVPLLLPPALPLLQADRMPPSAAHRLLIWRFVSGRIAERPLLGWGMDAARSIPGGKDLIAPAELDALGITRRGVRTLLLEVPHLPLHPHNAPLQLALELGLPGLLLGAALLAAIGLAASRCAAPAMAAGAMAAALVTLMLGYGAWQEWLLCSLGFTAVLLAALPPGARAAGSPPARVAADAGELWGLGRLPSRTRGGRR